MAHRDRLRAASTTPFSSRLLSRVLSYLGLPPLAWAGAALVERLLMQALGDRLLLASEAPARWEREHSHGSERRGETGKPGFDRHGRSAVTEGAEEPIPQ